MFKIIDSKIRFLLHKLTGILPQEDINNALELIEYNEFGVALELICTQLYEYDSVIDQISLDLIKELSNLMKFSYYPWEGIRVNK